jgi:signal transduction histidine kinase
MASTTRQVLTFAEPDRSPSSTVDLGAILQDSVRFAEGHPAFKEISIKVELPATPAHVKGNAVLFNQVFFNLLLNAAHFQPSGGEVELRCVRDEGKILITVLDQGPGIPEDLLEQIFEPFYSTRNSSGLGLAICRGIVGRYGGTLEAENRPGGGACFIVGLPELDSTLSGFAEQDSESASAGLI